MKNNRPFIENIKWLFIGNILTNIINIAISIYLIRKLAVSEFGIYSMFMGSLIVFEIFSINPVLVALKRFIPELVQKNYFSYLRTITFKLVSISFLIGGILIFAIYFLRLQVGSILQIDQFNNYYSLFIINIIMFLVNSFADSILISLQEQRIISILNIISVLVRGLMYSIFFSVINLNLIFIIEATSQFVKVIFSSFYVFRKINFFVKKGGIEITLTEKSVIQKRIKRFSFLSVANEAGSSILSQYSDYFFISAYLGPSLLGFYAFPYKLLDSIFNWLPIVKITEIIKPFFISKYYMENESEIYLEKMYNFFLKIFITLYAVIAINLVAYQSLIHIYIFNSKYISTQVLLVIVLVAFVFRSIAFPAGTIMEIKEKVEYLLVSKIFAILNIALVLSVLLFTNLSLIGVAIATTLSNILKNYYLHSVIRKKFKIQIYISQIVRVSIVLLFTGIVSIYLGYSLNNILLRVILPFLTGSFVFIISWRSLQPFNKHEREILDRLIKSLPTKFNIISKIFVLGS